MKKDFSQTEIEEELQNLKSKKKRLKKELDDLDTEIIGFKILLEKKLEEARYKLYQDQSKEH